MVHLLWFFLFFYFELRPSGSWSYVSPRFRELHTWCHLSDNRNSLFFVTSHRRCQSPICAMCRYFSGDSYTVIQLWFKGSQASPACPSDKTGFNNIDCIVYLWHDTYRLKSKHSEKNSIIYTYSASNLILMTGDRIRISAVAGRRLTSWVSARLQRERENKTHWEAQYLLLGEIGNV